MSFGFTPPLPPRPRNAWDPRIHHMMNDQSYLERFPPTPQYPASPYLNVPATPSSPFDASGVRAIFAAQNLRRNDVLDPDTLQVKNYQHPDVTVAFYQHFKSFSSELFTPHVHENCVKALKHIFYQQNEKIGRYRKERDQSRRDFIGKERELQALKINETVEREAVEAKIEAAVKKCKEDYDQLQIDFSNEQMTCEQLQKQFENERISHSELQEFVKAMEKRSDNLTKSRAALFNENSKLKERNAKVERDADLLQIELGRELSRNTEMQKTLEALKKKCDDSTQSDADMKGEIAALKEWNTKLESYNVQLRLELVQERSCKSEMQKSFESLEAVMNSKIAKLEERNRKLENDAEKVVHQRESVKRLLETCKSGGNTVNKFKKQKHDKMIEQISAQSSCRKRAAEIQSETNLSPKKAKITTTPDKADVEKDDSSKDTEEGEKGSSSSFEEKKEEDSSDTCDEIPRTSSPKKALAETSANQEVSPPAGISRPRRSTCTKVDYRDSATIDALMDDEERGGVNVSKSGRGRRGARGTTRWDVGRGEVKRTVATAAAAFDESEQGRDDTENGAEYGKWETSASRGRNGKRGRGTRNGRV